MITDDAGNQVSSVKYLPYGETRVSTGTLDTDKLFTGQRLDDTGLYYYNARYYDPTIGRFISADSIVPNIANPQEFNRYSYCTNNPLKYIDPSGHDGSVWEIIKNTAKDVTKIIFSWGCNTACDVVEKIPEVAETLDEEVIDPYIEPYILDPLVEQVDKLIDEYGDDIVDVIMESVYTMAEKSVSAWNTASPYAKEYLDKFVEMSVDLAESIHYTIATPILEQMLEGADTPAEQLQYIAGYAMEAAGWYAVAQGSTVLVGALGHLNMPLAAEAAGAMFIGYEFASLGNQLHGGSGYPGSGLIPPIF